MEEPMTPDEIAFVVGQLDNYLKAPPVSRYSTTDHAAWAEAALDAYNEEAPATLLPMPERAERVRLGILAAEAMAEVTFGIPSDRVVDDQHSADRVIGDLVVNLFCLTDGRISPRELHQAAEELRSEASPGSLTAVSAVTAAGAEREAAMLAALLDAAQSFECDVPAMVDSARDYFEDLKADEAEQTST
ncbi:hypothetical protein ACODT5_01205 [Streptomyces sp. 5.8]|uniref:hypothetical protein n=1 Tax=Streptomyces sp. 5.8 TaxID=3406571 RepID=UPI003BB6FA1A